MSTAIRPIPAGHEGLIPHLVCDPCADAIEFYKQAFGAEEVHRMPAPDGRRIMHAAIRIGGRFVFLVDDFQEFDFVGCSTGRSAGSAPLGHHQFGGGKASSPEALNGTPVTIHQYVEDCDAAIKRAEDAGATVLMPAQDMFWGDRYGVVTDPFGHHWSFATHLKDLTPAEIESAMKEAFAQGR
jgi:PhnB protein